MDRVRIGVTGHRSLAELDRIEAGVDAALDLIERAYQCGSLDVLSSLAEGADRIVAKRVLARSDARLIVVLPLPEADYERDFDSQASKRDFQALLEKTYSVRKLAAAHTRSAAYEMAGVYILEHCDVLLAVWDGKAMQGQGGTAEIVEMARAQLKPLVIVRAGNRWPGTSEPTTLGPEQGHVLAERLPMPPSGGHVTTH